jgi:hypothetical protein
MFSREFKLAAVQRLERGGSNRQGVVGVGSEPEPADPAGVDWKSAVYRKVREEVRAGGRLTVERLRKLGAVEWLRNGKPVCFAGPKTSGA